MAKKDNHVVQHDVTPEQYRLFADLVKRKASEREIEHYLSENWEVLSLAIWMFSTGHHMSWIFPKEQIRPPSGAVGGLIPDYLVAGAGSDGVRWFVLELKGADKRAFIKVASGCPSRTKRIKGSASSSITLICRRTTKPI